MRKLIFILLLLPNVTVAQFAEGLFSSKNQQLIEDAVGNGFFVLSQSYQLKDSVTNQLFGRSGRNEFGIVYSLGIKLEGGFCLGDRAIRPWEYDEHFDTYRTSHVPVIYKTLYKEISGNQLKSLVFSNRSRTQLASNRFYQVADSVTFNGDGLETDRTYGEKKGWLVWVEADKPLEQADSANVSYIVYRNELTIEKNKNSYEVKAPFTDKQLWGGVFVQPVQTAVGQITFRLVGLLDKKDDKWNIITPFAGRPVVTINATANDELDELVPVGNSPDDTKNRKKKK